MNIQPYLKLMAEKNASDLFLTTAAPVSIKIEGETRPLSKTPLAPGMVKKIAYSLLDEDKIREFEQTKEMNTAVSVSKVGRFRINIYQQRGEVSMVVRYIKVNIPVFETLNLPPVLQDLIMLKNGLILMVGSTGSGKSTTLASMVDHRNANKSGHILTVEDPIEYVFSHKKSIVGQREVGMDTLSYDNALREAMREAPDVIIIGEIRDRKTMEAAITYADTGHLCLSTLHAVNSNQALDRIINLFPTDAKHQILMDLSLNLRGIISQRLIPGVDGKRKPAVEVMVTTPYVSELIKKGELGEIKEIMAKGGASGMQTFDQSLYELYKDKKVSLEDALNNADSRGNLEWQINFGGGVKGSDAPDEIDFASPKVAAADVDAEEEEDNTIENASDGVLDDLIADFSRQQDGDGVEDGSGEGQAKAG
ncbi:MAG: PilT/PilU family type 4a pilus ATPase [Gammaproteobacteria bacterium]